MRPPCSRLLLPCSGSALRCAQTYESGRFLSQAVRNYAEDPAPFEAAIAAGADINATDRVRL